MKERIIKILSIIGLIPLTMGVFFLGQLPLTQAYYKPIHDTQFGENYTPEKFEKIAIGMTLGTKLLVSLCIAGIQGHNQQQL